MMSDSESKSAISRRQFLEWAASAGFGALAAGPLATWSLAQQGGEIENPLAKYPDRNWEKVYRDVFRYDSSFVFLCAPNDTHNCLLRAYVKNGVIARIGPTYGYGEATDAYGNRASHRWDPRCCQKGLGLVRRFYGDRRVRYPMVRKGFKEWVDKGFPRDPQTGQPPVELFQRGWDGFVRVSWEEAFAYAAKAMENIVRTYSGEAGAARLRAQGYDESMIAAMEGAGTRTCKFRGGMPLLGTTRIYGLYRFANSLALLDAKVRGVTPDKALGGRGWDNYSWHTDLPPGHPMVTGQQTVEFDLFGVENANMVVVWGMNWISTKMPDGHWLSEARMRGTKVVVIACEYSSTTAKADAALIVRPGTMSALALGFANVIVQEKLYDEDYVINRTDLPLLVRLDNLKLLRAADVQPNYQLAELKNYTVVMKPEDMPPPGRQGAQHIPTALREEWGDFVMWDEQAGSPRYVTRDQVGNHFKSTGIKPALFGEFEVTLKDGSKVKVAPVFELTHRYLADNFSPAAVEEMTWAPKEAVVSLAREFAANNGKVLFAVGMGPNQFFNNDNKDRALFLLAALTGNVGKIAGNVGSYAGNYRVALFNGLPQYVLENPFDIELDPAKPARSKLYLKFESAHWFNYGDRPLKAGHQNLTGKTQMPTPTKVAWWANSNSILGNTKWHYDVVNNTLPKVELLCVSEWWWSATCEYADIVFAVDSWAELKFPDMTASVTNPFLQIFPRTPLPRILDTRSDIEVTAGVAQALAQLTGESRFVDYWKFVHDGQVEVYLQRILNASTSTKGYRIEELVAQAERGVPSLMMMRTYPKAVGWEQVEESKPWYTKTGRLEFYRDEDEFIASGENLVVHREPIDSTFYEPNVIVAKPHPAIRPQSPAEYGLSVNDLSPETRQVRHVVKSWEEVKRTQHPLQKDGFGFIFHTPKYRHGAHTTPVDTDVVAVLFGPFGDPYRRDERMPFVTEGYVDINPADARALGIEDGDYVWIDADPSDRPYRGWKPSDQAYKVARLLCRARYYNGTPRGVTRMWFNMYGATPGTVKGQQTRPDKLAKNPETNYQSMFRSGSHQSGTRAWIKPTLVTDSLARKGIFGQVIGKGFEPDTHCPTGAPREAFVKITKAEPGGIGGKGVWRPVAQGLRPMRESEEMKKYLEGAFVE
ncbi:MAG: molybdopterin-dependent oxidoreductase [Abditibacteriales bacterium]|nr:molybdopterin-dependent oxidoreductase [Abditibacteriales bacterium]